MQFQQKFQEEIVNALIWRTCLNCEFRCKEEFADITKTPLCTKYSATPPANIIVHGCPSHVFDIPF